MVNEGARRLAQIDPDGKSLDMAPTIWGEMFDLSGHRVPPFEWPCAIALAGEVVVGREYQMVRSDLSSYHLLCSASPIKNAYHHTVGSITTLTDISEHQRRQRVLCEEAVFTERTRIAADIHDTVVQGLNAVIIHLEAAEQELLENLEKARQRLHRVRDIARDSLVEARHFIWAWSGEFLNNEDPATALRLLAHKLFEGTSVQLQFRLERAPCKLTPQTSMGLLRIGKEALVNVWKHAHAKRVLVELTYGKRDVRLSVLDDGRGYVAVPLSNATCGFGLFGFQIWAERLGGKVIVHSRPKLGTRVVASIPLAMLAIRDAA
jgi:signal transduction histidine kinase